MNDEPLHVVVIGASGGIGAALLAQLHTDARVGAITALARAPERILAGRARCGAIDLGDEASIEAAAAFAAQAGALHRVFVATGVLRDSGRAIEPEKSSRALSAASLMHVYQINAVGPALTSKHFAPRLARLGPSVFAALSARVGSIEDNRLGGWHSYRASKAALNMLIRNAAIELARTHPQAICVTLHPGTVDTALSAPFQANVPAQKLFSPAESAGHLLRVVDGLSVADSGGFFAWDGQRIPF